MPVVDSPKYKYQELASSRLGTVAFSIIILVLVVSVLYPDTFLPDFLKIGSFRILPLSVLLPFLALSTSVYIFCNRSQLSFGLLDAVFLSFLAFTLMRNVFSPNGAAEFKYSVYALGLFYSVSLLIRRTSRLRLMIWVFIGLILVTTVYGFIEYSLQENILYQSFVSVTEPMQGIHRLSSTLVQPVSYGAFLIQILPFGILAWITGKGFWHKFPGVMALLLGVPALFLTYSKGSWITGIIIFFAGFPLIKMKKVSIIPGIVLAAMVILLSAIFWQSVLSETAYRAESSVAMRLGSWSAAWHGFLDHPVFGVGLRQGTMELERQSPEIKVYNEQEKAPLAVDNYYLDLMMEEGAVSFLLWVTFLVLLCTEGIIGSGANRPGRLVVLTALASVVGLSLNALTFDAMLIWPNFILFWAAAGILHGTCQKDKHCNLKPPCAGFVDNSEPRLYAL